MSERQYDYINTTYHGLADLHTPVSLFLKLRDHYPMVFLLESSDYSGQENSQSLLCFDLLEEISIKDHKVTMHNTLHQVTTSSHTNDAVNEVNQFIEHIKVKGSASVNGIFGYTSFNAVKYFEPNLPLKSTADYAADIRYGFFRFIIVIDHFNDTLQIIENCPSDKGSQIDHVRSIINRQDVTSYSFSANPEVKSNMTDAQFMNIVTQCKAHCKRGDVFQIVPSRRYDVTFEGDEINVYRHLRSINPSPYLFYFDYGSYKIFGSSPEAQIRVKDQIAEIHPIAGTVKRSGQSSLDQEAAKRLYEDPKENAEHIMLVDLARNDLSKHCTDVQVHKYKELQYFSHVIHLTSVVKGHLAANTSPYTILADTFPAGTLSGAPKHKAISLLNEIEPDPRTFYGGGIGYIGLDKSLNHAIVIRSFYSHNQTLSYQAGAGVVIMSDESSELQEVNNKLAALNKAINAASIKK